MNITDTQSYSLVIRDAFFNTLAAAPFFAQFTPRKTQALPVQPQHLPYLGVYIADEMQLPDGDLSAGHIAFIHTLRLMLSVIVQNNDPEDCERQLDQAFWAVNNRLWRDQYLMNMLDTRSPGSGGTPDNTRLEGVARGLRRNVYGVAGHDNETPVGELQYEISVVYRTEFAPIITDDLLEVHLTTGVKHGDTLDEMAKRVQAQQKLVLHAED